MLKGWFRKPEPIGLDVSRDCVRMLQLEAEGRSARVAAAACRAVPEPMWGNSSDRRGFIIEAVREMLQSGRFRGRHVVTCLRGDELTIKQMRLPRMGEQELERAVRAEAAERFGHPVSPEMLHCIVAGEVRQGADASDEIILIGARDDTVEDHIRLLDDMDISPVWVDAEPACVFRPFERFLRRDEDRQTVSVHVHVDSVRTWVVFARGRRIGFLKAIGMGGRELDEAVAGQLDLPAGEARRLRMAKGASSAGSADASSLQSSVHRAVYDAVRPVAESLAREINLCLRYCSVTFRGSRAEALTLCGPEAGDSYLQRLISEYTNVECEVGRPLRGIDVSQAELGGDLRGPLSEWTVAAGLALRSMTAESSKRERGYGEHRLSA